MGFTGRCGRVIAPEGGSNAALSRSVRRNGGPHEKDLSVDCGCCGLLTRRLGRPNLQREVRGVMLQEARCPNRQGTELQEPPRGRAGGRHRRAGTGPSEPPSGGLDQSLGFFAPRKPLAKRHSDHHPVRCGAASPHLRSGRGSSGESGPQAGQSFGIVPGLHGRTPGASRGISSRTGAARQASLAIHWPPLSRTSRMVGNEILRRGAPNSIAGNQLQGP